MLLKQQIEKIHASDTYGAIIEIGAGCPVASNLFEIAGASKTILFSASPYSKEVQEEQYKFQSRNIRSVSKEAILRILRIEAESVFALGNTIFASSFQVMTDGEGTTHGWIGLMEEKSETMMFYHVTIHPTGFITSRKELIALIGVIGTKILYHRNNIAALKEEPIMAYIDIISDHTGNEIELTLEGFEKYDRHDKISYITADGKVERIETLLRENPKELILYKGSFNPIHNLHLNLLKHTEDKLKTKGVFVISYSTFNKGTVSPQELAFRIKCLNKLGYGVLITSTPFFVETVNILQGRNYKGDTYFLVGTDTINRLIESTFNNFATQERVDAFHTNFKECKFIIHERDAYPLSPQFEKLNKDIYEFSDHVKDPKSSTTVRELAAQGKYDEIKTIIPVPIFEDYINFIKK